MLRPTPRSLAPLTLARARRRAAVLLLAATLGFCIPALSQEPPAPKSPGSQAPPEDTRPNLILILSDDHRWDALGAAGNPAIHTRVLDRLARTGIYFPQATIHVSQCPPTRATMLTGLPPHTHGFHAHQYQDPKAKTAAFCRRPTLPGLLRDAGYHTALVGKWHLAADPWNCGFSEIGTWIPAGAAPYLDPGNLAHGKSWDPVQGKGYTQEILAGEAIDFVHRRKEASEPYFLWLAVTAPHLPYGPNPPRIRELYAGKKPHDLLPPGFPESAPIHDQWVEYYEAVSHLDEQIGRVLEAAAASAGDRETLVVFLGDNGYMMGERGIGLRGAAGKVVPYEGSLRVPLILATASGSPTPGGSLTGLEGTSTWPVSSLDLPPTLLGLAGVEAPETWPGRDVLAAMRAGEPIEEAFSEWSDNRSPRFGTLAFRAIRTSRYKLIDWEDPDTPDELYDLESDPHEQHNLFGDPEQRSVRDDLSRRLHVWRVDTGDPTLGAKPTSPEPEP